MATAIDRTPYDWLKPLVKLAVICGFTSVILVMLLGQSRVFYSMSRDGLLPKVFSDVHPRWKTPWRSNLLFMLFVSLFSAFAPISVVGHMTSIGTLLAFVIVCAGIMIMRYTHPNIPRPFKTPLVPVVPILGILVCVAMMYSLGPDNWFRLFAWLVIGQMVFFGYSRVHSRLRPTGVIRWFSATDRILTFANAGLLAGGTIAYLLRPVAASGKQLAFDVVIARGANLKPAESFLRPLAEASFNTLMLGVVAGAVAGAVVGYLVYLLKRPAEASHAG